MKKKIIGVLLLFGFFLPVLISAASVSNALYSSNSNVVAGEELETKLSISLDGISKDGKIAIFGVNYTLTYDKKFLRLVSTNTSGFDDFFKPQKTGQNIISLAYGSSDLSTYKTVSDESLCSNGAYYCLDNYTSYLSFIPIVNKNKSTEIKISKIIVYAVDYTNSNNIKVVSFPYNKTLKIKVNVSSSSEKIDAKSILSVVTDKNKVDVSNVISKAKTKVKKNIKSIYETTTTKTKKTSTGGRSSNYYLSKLNIKGYRIEFDKEKFKYEIEVDKSVNSLDVTYKTEDKNAKVVVTGDKDLKAHGDKVVIEVTADDLTKKEYTIFVDRKIEKVKEKFSLSKAYKKLKSKIFNNKKNRTILMIIGINILLIVMLVVVINKINGKKIDKYLDKM